MSRIAVVTALRTPGMRAAVDGVADHLRRWDGRRNLIGDPLAPEGQRNIDNYFNKDNIVLLGDPEHQNPFGTAGRNVT